MRQLSLQQRCGYSHTSDIEVDSPEEREQTNIFRAFFNVLSRTALGSTILLGKQIRALVYFRKDQGLYVPVAIVKKTSKRGDNITKENYLDLFQGDIRRSLQDLRERKYELEEL